MDKKPFDRYDLVTLSQEDAEKRCIEAGQEYRIVVWEKPLPELKSMDGIDLLIHPRTKRVVGTQRSDSEWWKPVDNLLAGRR